MTGKNVVKLAGANDDNTESQFEEALNSAFRAFDGDPRNTNSRLEFEHRRELDDIAAQRRQILAEGEAEYNTEIGDLESKIKARGEQIDKLLAIVQSAQAECARLDEQRLTRGAQIEEETRQKLDALARREHAIEAYLDAIRG